MDDSRRQDKSELPLTGRLAVVFADELRPKMVMELNKREMSANEFFKEFGGGSVSRVSRHLGRLEEYWWLDHVRTETGGRRRGSVERFYRATAPVAVDNRTWSELPDSIRRVYSCHTFEQLGECVTAAMEAGTFDARSDRHFTWTPALLDRLGWRNVTARTDALFEYVFEEQESAKLRRSESGEEPISATVALAVFESPDGTRARAALARRRSAAPGGKGRLEMPALLRLSKVFANPLHLKIVTELSEREMSASQFFKEFGGHSVSSVSGHFRKLKKYWWFDQTRTETGGRRRGSVERFYRATGPPVFDHPSGLEVPDSIKRSGSWRSFEQLGERIMTAMAAGTFDARGDRHFTWTPAFLDRLGWRNVIARTGALFDYVFEEQEKAKSRLSKSGEEPIPATVALAVFESPKDSSRAP